MKGGIMFLFLVPAMALLAVAEDAVEIPEENFINIVHAQGAEIAKEMVVDGNQVVWSPYSVVNVLPLVNGNQSLKKYFNTSLEYIQELEGVKVRRLSSVYFLDNIVSDSVTEVAENFGISLIPNVEPKQVQQTLSNNYKAALGVNVPEGFIPASLEGASQVFLTSLLLRGVWDTPFRYAPRSKFYMNDTNAVKTKYMSSIGYFKYGEIEGLDAKLLALPLKNTTTTYFLIVLPNNYSSLPEVSQQFGRIQLANILQNLTTSRTQLVLPKVDVDSQLVLQPSPSVKILQSGSIRLTYAGFDNRASRLKRGYQKHLRTRVNKKDIRFLVNHPFIFLVYDTEVGVLNYGEVLLPTTESTLPFRLKSSENNVDNKLNQNAKNLVEYYNEIFGSNLYQQLRVNREGNFVISPVTLTHLLASYSAAATNQVQLELFSTLNSRDGILDVYNNINYFNSTSSNCSTVVGNGNQEFNTSVVGLGTKVVASENDDRTQGLFNYTFLTRLRSTKRFKKTFFLNERDSVNATFYEYIGGVKYVGLPYWDAKAVQVFVSPTQSLLFFVPNERSGLHLVEEGLRDFSVSKLLCQMSDRFVRLRLPAFDVGFLNDIYPEVRDVLNVNELQFEGLGNAVLDSIVQNVTISVSGNEDGKAKIRVSKYKLRKPNTRFNVDRPFVFYLFDNTIGSLAIGRVVSLPSTSVLPPLEETATESQQNSTAQSEVSSSISPPVSTELPTSTSPVSTELPISTDSP